MVGTYRLQTDGLWYQPPDMPDKKNPSEWVEQEPIWLCSGLTVLSLAVDEDGSWGKLLSLVNPDRKEVQWVMPFRSLAENDKLWPALLDKGLSLTSNAIGRKALHAYLNEQMPPARAQVMTRLGWYENDGLTAFVMPDQVFGETDIKIVYQNAAFSNPYRVKGSVEGWCEQVGKLCVGNSRLILAASAAFAAALLNITGDEGGGIHFQGGSRDGKTTTQYIGGSVAGSRDITQTWRATDNGLEAVCEERCDGLLCLDEIGQIEPKVAGKIAYMIANGEGKSRMMSSTALRRTKKWRVLFLSSGEVGLAELMAEEGKKARAGQQIRLLEVPSNAGAGYGIFEDIHGFEAPKLFADHLRNVTMEIHGAPLRGFLDHITAAFTEDPAALRSELRHQRDRFVRDNLTAGASGQVGSACARFGLIAIAGEVATRLGLTGWPEGTAIGAAQKCFRAWLEKRGSTGDYDMEAAIRQVVAYVEQFGNSRFENLDCEGFVTGLRVGFRKHDKNQTEYLVLPAMWQTELCKGYDAKAVAEEMVRRGLLIPDKKGKSSTSMRVGHYGQMRVYRLSPTIINGGAAPYTRTEAQKNKDMIDRMMADPAESSGGLGETPSETPETPLKHVFH